MGSAHLDKYEKPFSKPTKKDQKRNKKRNPLVKEIFDGNYIPKSEVPKTVYKRNHHVDWKEYRPDDEY